MPTAPRAIAALMMAITGILVAGLYRTYLTYNSATTGLPEAAGAVGLVIGWAFLGKRIERGASELMTGLAAALIWALSSVSVFAVWEMISRSTKLRYHNPSDAVGDVFALAVERFQLGLQPDVVAVLILSSVVSAAITGWSARRWS